MGEAKNRAKAHPLQAMHDELLKAGKLVEAGWISLRIAAVPADAPEIQLDEMRSAFFAGAQHLMGCIMTVLDPGEEPTLEDLQRMDRIQRELDAFLQDFQLRKFPTQGKA